MAHETATFCRICEPHCGLVATVEGGRITSVRGDSDNPLSQGFLCTKAAAMVEVTEDPDRVLRPLKRVGGPGEFEPVSWDEALDDIATRLRAITAAHGPDAYASFYGNPPAFSGSTMMWVDGFQRTIGSKWKYGVNGEDGASMIVANALLFGNPAMLPKPDLWRTDFLLMLGANPFVSHGSGLTEPRIRQALESIVERGGRVVVVDPRRTETARRFEHVAVRPGGDPWFLLGLIGVLLDRGLLDREFIAAHASGLEELRAAVAAFPLDRCAERSGVDRSVIEQLAAALAAAPAAVVYGRTGTCTQRFGTLNNFLQGVLNALTGNIERPGGWVAGWGFVDFGRFARMSGMATYDKFRTRVRDLPEALGMLPSQGLAADIVTPGPGQIRALMTLGANPVLTSGAGGPELQAALEQLDLHFSLDLYVNETNKHAHYVLPATSFYERADLPLLFSGSMLRPALFATEAVVARRGEAREEWEVLHELARRMGRGGAYAVAPLRWLARAGVTLTPPRLYDLLIRTSAVGDWFGLRREGLSWRKLIERHPHGVQLKTELPVHSLRKLTRTKDRRLALAPAEILAELRRLDGDAADGRFPLRAIGMRETRSHNSWMHNVPRLVPDGRRPAALVNPGDAADIGLEDGQPVTIESKSGSIVIDAHVTDDVAPGTVAIPHCWGHDGGWQRANAAGGATSNLLASSELDDVEPLAGMSVLNGIPIRLSAVAGNGPSAQRSASSLNSSGTPEKSLSRTPA